MNSNTANAAAAILDAGDFSGGEGDPHWIPEPLTPREREVLSQIVQGKTLEQAAQTLNISRNTVHTHVKSIYGKTRVRSRAQVVIAAIRLGLVSA